MFGVNDIEIDLKFLDCDLTKIVLKQIKDIGSKINIIIL